MKNFHFLGKSPVPYYKRCFCHPAPSGLQEKRPERNKNENPCASVCQQCMVMRHAATWIQWATANSSDFLQSPPPQVTVQTSRTALGCFSDLSYAERLSIRNTIIYLFQLQKFSVPLKNSDIPGYVSQICLHIMNYSLLVKNKFAIYST